MTMEIITAKGGGRPVVQIAGMTFSYNGASVLENVTLTINEGDFVGIIGPNGGGKTTLLKIILGLLQPNEGTVRVFGKAPGVSRPRAGYVPQHAALDMKFPVNVMDVVLLGRLGKGRPFGPFGKADKEAARRALETLEVPDLAKKTYGDLSGGQQQRVLIARALASEPELLLLDEPTANLDLQMETDFYELLTRLNEKLTIVMVSHDLGVVSRFFRRVVCVKRTAVIHPTSRLSGEMIREMYGSDVCMVRHDQVTS